MGSFVDNFLCHVSGSDSTRSSSRPWPYVLCPVFIAMCCMFDRICIHLCMALSPTGPRHDVWMAGGPVRVRICLPVLIRVPVELLCHAMTFALTETAGCDDGMSTLAPTRWKKD